MIITKNHAADPEKGFLTKSIPNHNGGATAMPTAWELIYIYLAWFVINPRKARRLVHIDPKSVKFQLIVIKILNFLCPPLTGFWFEKIRKRNFRISLRGDHSGIRKNTFVVWPNFSPLDLPIFFSYPNIELIAFF